MKTFLLASTVLVATASVTGALAADLVVETPVVDMPDAGYDWSGAYVGGHIGYVSGNVDWELVPQPAPADSYGIEGWLLGAQAGYNWQMDTFVLGLEGDLSLGDVTSDLDETGFIERSVNWEASLRARAGVSFDAILLYGTAGLAVLDTTSELFGLLDDTQTHIGWTVGAGVEAMVAEDVSAKLEYRYSDYGTQTYEFFPAPIVSDSSITAHSISAGFNFHF
jgi:outer membrane immunogenic protein